MVAKKKSEWLSSGCSDGLETEQSKQELVDSGRRDQPDVESKRVTKKRKAKDGKVLYSRHQKIVPAL